MRLSSKARGARLLPVLTQSIDCLCMGPGPLLSLGGTGGAQDNNLALVVEEDEEEPM